MDEGTKRLFVGIKITKALQDDLANPAPGTKQYFEGTNDDYLQIITPLDLFEQPARDFSEQSIRLESVELLARNAITASRRLSNTADR